MLTLEHVTTATSDALEHAVRYARMSSDLQFQVRPKFTHTNTPDDELKAKCILIVVKVLNQLAEEEWKRAFQEHAEQESRRTSILPSSLGDAASSVGATIAG